MEKKSEVSTSSSLNVPIDEIKEWLKEFDLEMYYEAFKKAGFTNRKSIASLKKGHLEKMGITIEVHFDILLDNAPLKILSSGTSSSTVDESGHFERNFFSSRPSFLPHADNVSEYLLSVPPKIPIDQTHFEWALKYLSNREASDFFDIRSNGSVANLFFAKEILPLLEKPITFETEDSLHTCFDRCLIRPAVLGNMSYDRNTNRDTSSGSSRPDSAVYFNGRCFLRGEEKRSLTAQPGDQLVESLAWNPTFKGAPYIFGYFTRRLSVTFCLIFPLEGFEEIRRKEIITLDLNNVINRLQAWNIVRNMTFLFPLLEQHCKYPSISSTIKRKDSEGQIFKIISYEKGYMKKKWMFELTDTLKKHWEVLYKKLEIIPNVEHLQKPPRKHKSTFTIKFEPVGEPAQPSSEEELIHSLKCILEALVALHKIGIIHRDIRWPNIVRTVESWILIDFEDASITCPASHTSIRKMDSITHAPELQMKKNHDEKVDMWSVGFLISSVSHRFRVSQELIELSQQLLNHEPEKRYSAEKTLSILNQLNTS